MGSNTIYTTVTEALIENAGDSKSPTNNRSRDKPHLRTISLSRPEDVVPSYMSDAYYDK